jgi:hypothetical protein
MHLLRRVSVGVLQSTQTQWSIIYDISKRNVSVAIGRNYENIHEFHLD